MKINLNEIKNVSTMQGKILELKRLGLNSSDIVNYLLGKKTEVTESELRHNLNNEVQNFINR